jgi:hypothetical protein
MRTDITPGVVQGLMVSSSQPLSHEPGKDESLSIQMVMQQCKQILTQEKDDLVTTPAPALQEKSLLE